MSHMPISKHDVWNNTAITIPQPPETHPRRAPVSIHDKETTRHSFSTEREVVTPEPDQGYYQHKYPFRTRGAFGQHREHTAQIYNHQQPAFLRHAASFSANSSTERLGHYPMGSPTAADFPIVPMRQPLRPSVSFGGETRYSYHSAVSSHYEEKSRAFASAKEVQPRLRQTSDNSIDSSPGFLTSVWYSIAPCCTPRSRGTL